MNIVVVTGYTDVSPQQISQKMNSSARLFYIQKPFHFEEIYQFASALSENWKIQTELKDFYAVMEEQMGSQSTELSHAQQHVNRVLTGRQDFQEELSQKTQHVEEVNTALRSLLKEKEQEKEQLENSFIVNINESISPYLVQLTNTSLTDDQKSIVLQMENNLSSMISSFSQKHYT